MPYTWTDNELFLKYKKISIYHVYHDNMEQGGKLAYWFGCSPTTLEDDPDTFDVRDLADPSGLIDIETEKGKKELIKHAINSGQLDKYFDTLTQ